MPLRFVNPNFHVILIHYPLGIFVLGVFLELFSFMWRRSPVRFAARWMIVLGALLTLPAATSGIYALYDVKTHQGLTDARYLMLRWHVIYMGIASLLAVFCAVIGMGSSDHWRRRLYLPLLLGVVAAWALMVVGAWHGGETIYQQGTSVAIIKSEDGKNQLQPLPDSAADIHGEKEQGTDAATQEKYDKIVDYYLGGDLQLHLILAGFAFALAMGALGLSMRRMNAGEVTVEDIIVKERVPVRGGAIADPRRAVGADPRRVTDDISVIRSFNPDAAYGGEVAADVPAGRFWLLTALVVIVTLAAGYWVMEGMDALKASSFQDFKADCMMAKGWPFNRHQAHFYLGAAFLAFSLICGVLAWLAPKQPILLALFSLLLIAVIAAQVWIGVLLTFDGGGGTLYHFRTPEERKSHHKKVEEIETQGPIVDPIAGTLPSIPSTLPDTLPTTLPVTLPTTVPDTAK